MKNILYLEKENKETISKYPQAWEMIKNEKIEESSYFGIKLSEVLNNKISLQEFLEELQNFLNK